MGDIEALTELNFVSVFLGIFILVIAFNKIVEVVGKAKKNIDKPVSWFKNRNKDHELIMANAQAIKDLAEIHEKDNQISNEHDDMIRGELSTFMSEVRSDISELKNSIQQSYENNLNYRQVSIEKEQRLNSRIDDMLESDKQRDKTVDEIGNGLNKLTNMFIEKQIADYRWSIINFATAVSEKKPCTKESFKHAFATYEKYEKILEDNGLENGEVKISMEIINEAYKDKMLNGFN